MPFKKGQSGNPNGRKTGSENKETKLLRERLSMLIEDQYPRFIKEINKLEGQQYVTAIKDLLEYTTPKLNRTDLTNDGEKFDFSVLSDAELINELRKIAQSITRTTDKSE